MDRLTALSAAFLAVEDANTPMTIGSAAICAGPVPTADEIAAVFTRALPEVPRYRQRLQKVPLGLGRPVWVEDQNFRWEHHLRRTAVPAPGGDAELAALVGRLMSVPLDRHRPLWEGWTVEGLSGGRWALGVGRW